MRREPLASSSLRSAGYDATDSTLEIEYANGGVYRYHDVPELVHRQLLKADSPGTFVNSRIKPYYRFTER